MRVFLVITLALACVLGACGQTSAQSDPPFQYKYIVGGGLSCWNPGCAGTVDIDVHAAGIFYAHTAVGNIMPKNGQLYATVRPGAEAHVYTSSSGLTGIVAKADGGVALGATTTLSQFTGGGYVWVDLCASVKRLQKFGHCFVEAGGSIAAGSAVSSTSGQQVELVPSIEFRFGGN
jgi:hypothetical protein